jgi:hypothetical protein
MLLGHLPRKRRNPDVPRTALTMTSPSSARQNARIAAGSLLTKVRGTASPAMAAACSCTSLFSAARVAVTSLIQIPANSLRKRPSTVAWLSALMRRMCSGWSMSWGTIWRGLSRRHDERQLVRGDEAERHRVVTRPLQLAARKYPRRIAVNQPGTIQAAGAECHRLLNLHALARGPHRQVVFPFPRLLMTNPTSHHSTGSVRIRTSRRQAAGTARSLLFRVIPVDILVLRGTPSSTRLFCF